MCIRDRSKTINITAYDNEVLIGCLRILTDGYYFGTITELLVLPEYQKQAQAVAPRKSVGQSIKAVSYTHLPRKIS